MLLAQVTADGPPQTNMSPGLLKPDRMHALPSCLAEPAGQACSPGSFCSSRTSMEYPYRNFPQNSQNFPLNSQNFPQTHKRTLEYSKSSPIRRFERRTEDYPILGTFLFFITERRFGGVGAPEGPRERVSLFIRKFSAK